MNISMVCRSNTFHNFTLQTDSPLIQITNLTSNATYNITATLMHSNNQYTNAVRLDSVTTLPIGYYPENITNPELKVELSKTSNKTLDMFVSWDPADDQTCHYYIYSYSSEDDFHHIPYKLIKDVGGWMMMTQIF